MGQIEMAFADGGVIGPNPSELGGTWAWVHLLASGEPVVSSGVVTPAKAGMERITNNFTELLACLRCLEALPEGWAGNLHTDSRVTQCRLVNTNPGMAGIPDYLQNRLWRCRQRAGNFKVILLDGHPTQAQLASGVGKRGNPCSRWNVLCDKLCNERSTEFRLALNQGKPAPEVAAEINARPARPLTTPPDVISVPTPVLAPAPVPATAVVRAVAEPGDVALLDHLPHCKRLGIVANFYLPAHMLDVPLVGAVMRSTREMLHDHLLHHHNAYTHEAGSIGGFWRSDSGSELDADRHERFEVAISPGEVEGLVTLLGQVCRLLGERAVYLSLGDVAWLVSPLPGVPRDPLDSAA